VKVAFFHGHDTLVAMYESLIAVVDIFFENVMFLDRTLWALELFPDDRVLALSTFVIVPSTEPGLDGGISIKKIPDQFSPTVGGVRVGFRTRGEE
jgi:hypothetical protein